MPRAKLLLAAAGSGILSGCVVPMLMHHPVQFISEPPGAAVSYEGKTIGTTPFVYDVRDRFGFFSVYAFTAHLPNHPDVAVSFREPSILHAQGVMPDTVNFIFGDSPSAMRCCARWYSPAAVNPAREFHVINAAATRADTPPAHCPSRP